MLSDRIRIGYCLYYIRIRTEHSDTNTDIDGCEKMISRIRQNRISDTDPILADRMQILIGYVKLDKVKDKLNRYNYYFLSHL